MMDGRSCHSFPGPPCLPEHSGGVRQTGRPRGPAHPHTAPPRLVTASSSSPVTLPPLTPPSQAHAWLPAGFLFAGLSTEPRAGAGADLAPAAMALTSGWTRGLRGPPDLLPRRPHLSHEVTVFGTLIFRLTGITAFAAFYFNLSLAEEARPSRSTAA